MPPVGHAKRSPSSLKMFQISPCYLPNNETNSAAERGTLCHDAVETGKDDNLTEKELGWVQSIRNYIKPLQDLAVSEWPEIRLEVQDDGKTIIWGTTDLLILTNDGVLHLLDWKFGQWPVDEAPENLQLRAYALGAFQQHPEVREIQVHLLQPPRDEVSTHTYIREKDYEDMLVEIRGLLDDSTYFEKHGLYAPSFDTCRFCARLGSCPVAQTRFVRFMEQWTHKRFERIPPRTNPSAFSQEEANSMMDLAGLGSSWSSAIKQRVLNGVLIDKQEPPSKYQIVSQTDRKWAEGSATSVLDAAEALGLTKEQVLDSCQPHRQSLVDAVRAAAPKGQKGKREEDLMEFLQDNQILVEGETKTYLKRKVERN